MNHTQRISPTGHRLGEHGQDIRNMAFRHRNVDETPLIIALGLAILVVAAVIWCCLSAILQTRAKRSGVANHDPEAAEANEPTSSDSVPPFTSLNALHDPRSGQNSKGLRSKYNRTRSVTLPHPVYDSFHYGVSLANLGIGNPHRFEYMDIRGRQLERSRSSSSLPPLPLYRPTAELSSAFIEQDLQSPPEYSPGSPSSPTPTQASTPIGDATNRIPEVHDIDDETNISYLPWKRAEWKDFPLSLSQPTIREISGTLNRALSSPGRCTTNTIVPNAALHTPTTTWPYGTNYTIFVDHFGRIVIPPLSIGPEQVDDSDSIVTISPCDMISTDRHLSDAEFSPSHHDDRACQDSCYAVTALASEYLASEGTSHPADSDEGSQKSNLTPLVHSHEASQIGTNSMDISA